MPSERRLADTGILQPVRSTFLSLEFDLETLSMKDRLFKTMNREREEALYAIMWSRGGEAGRYKTRTPSAY
jgi:hypothetical protein